MVINNTLLFALLLSIGSSNALANCEQQFDFKMDVTSTLKFQNEYSQQRSLLKERLSIVMLEKDIEGQWWGVKGDDVQLFVDNELLVDDDYKLPFAFKRNLKGLIIDFWFPKGVSDEAKLKLSGMAYLFQYSDFAQTADVAQSETDGIGKYWANYSIENDLIIRMKTNYEAIDGVNEKIAVDIKHSTTKYKPSNCLIGFAHGDEKLTHILLTGMEMETSSRFSFNSRTNILHSELFMMPKLLSEWHYSVELESVAELSIAEINKRAEQLNSFVLKNKLIDIDPPLLAKKLKKYEGALHTLTALLIDNSLPENDVMRLINAIGLIDTNESQQLLIDMILNEELDNANKFRAVQALSDSELPINEASYDKLSAVLSSGLESDDPILNSALILTVGTLISHNHDDFFAGKLQEQIVMQLSSASQVQDKLLFINALGNTKDANIVDVVANYSNDTEENIRIAAAEALGRFGSVNAYKNLGSQLSIEQSPYVQQALLSSIGQYHMDDDMKGVVMSYASNHNNSAVRGEAIIALSSKDNMTKEVKRELRNLLKTEKSKANFKFLVKAIHKN